MLSRPGLHPLHNPIAESCLQYEADRILSMKLSTFELRYIPSSASLAACPCGIGGLQHQLLGSSLLKFCVQHLLSQAAAQHRMSWGQCQQQA